LMMTELFHGTSEVIGIAQSEKPSSAGTAD